MFRAAVGQGSSFSAAMNAAMSAIQPMLITPTANSAAINAQQHPRHHAPCLIPGARPPTWPSRQRSARNIIGLRHLTRQASFKGVTWYTAAIRITPPAT